MRNQLGSALLSALIIVMICASLATMLLIKQRNLIHQATLVINSEQMMNELQRVQQWAIKTLGKNANLHQVKDFREDINGIHLEGKISALGGRFNLNLVSSDEGANKFLQLLREVLPEVKNPDVLTENLHRWFRGDPYYKKLDPPYRSGSQSLVTARELRQVRGFDAKIYERLAQGNPVYVTVLPDASTKANVNYASAPVLSVLAGVTLSDAENLVACRNQHFFFNTADFIKTCASGIKLNEEKLTVFNRYYEVNVVARYKQQRFRMTTLMRIDNAQQTAITLIWQQYYGI